ncbi:MAG: hypothetical protein PHC34_13870 [Candidatus Gastranaerophilales bacterium]|nr:hypothetical protein [Candidatus Gastranaerophilales bacterium]
MSLNIWKMGIGFTGKTPLETTQKAAAFIQTEKQNLAGEPPKDTVVITSKQDTKQKTTLPQTSVIEAAKTKKPVKTLTDKEKILLIQELKEKSQNGTLKPPTEDKIKIIMSMPLDDGFKNSLRGLFENKEISSDPIKYNKGVLEILNKYGLA